MQLIDTPLKDAVWGAAIGYSALWLVATVFERITHKQGMGAGDFKLLAALGAWLGPWALLPLVFLASLVGAMVGLGLQARQKLHQGLHVPFGPFLAAAGCVLAVTGHAFFLNLLQAH
jgi:leader peptidase (prepilin peptidase)/N-methyltransferase